MSRIEEIGNHLLWLAGHILFTVIVCLSLFGGYHTYLWYKTEEVMDVTQLENTELMRLSKEIAAEIKYRNTK